MKLLPQHLLDESQYFLESLSALHDFLKISPQMVKNVFTSAKIDKHIKIDASKVIDPPKNYPYKKKPVGVVKINTYSEKELFISVEADGDDKILFIDHIKDPHNLGAILRTAAFFGIRKVVVPSDRQVQLTQTVVNVSQGALSYCKFYVVTNLVRCIKKFKTKDFWVVGTALEGNAITEKPDLDKVLIILGAEDKGIGDLVKKNCDFLYKIDGAPGSVQSLNVSVATGIILEKFF